MAKTAYLTVLTDATRPPAGVEKVGALVYTHPVVLPDNVEASHEIASPPLRAAAWVLDMLILLMVAIPLDIARRTALALEAYVTAALLLIAIAAVALGYFFVFEGLYSGQTPGKRICGLRVITLEGEEIGPRQGLIRAFTRFAELLLFTWLVLIFERRHRRLGDFAAGALVVLQRTPRHPWDPPPVPGYFNLDMHQFPLASDELARLSPEDFVRLEQYGARLRRVRGQTRTQACMVAAHALATRMKYRHPITPEGAERFLFEVHAALKEQFRQLYPDLYV